MDKIAEIFRLYWFICGIIMLFIMLLDYSKLRDRYTQMGIGNFFIVFIIVVFFGFFQITAIIAISILFEPLKFFSNIISNTNDFREFLLDDYFV